MSAKSFDIVAYQKQDHEAVCSLLVESFKAKFQSLVTLEDQAIQQLLMQVWVQNPYSTSMKQFVAKENEEVIGVLSLKWKPSSSSLPETTPISLAPLIKQFGCFNIFKFLTGMHALEYPPAADECYIDHLAIRSSHRNQGIGRRLLAFAQQFTVESGFHTLTLHVAHKNQGAIRLYHKLAFEVEQSKYNGLRHFWFKEPVWHLMSWKENLHSRREHH
ncbi:GNAT family N-acetyltransferase [Paenibacillus sp. UKAQ_18]|uniref:GNAT family N-acetyltransferase n=1 Tax=Paenibacillus sp. MZ03-122A TaxID=2962033 RepID=UPI001F465FB2|nr:N-acetyltransferase [Paenibacillus sp. MZ03-122A]MCF2718354.1 GNAT family N-acetyltransferase [Paenibacillus sp. UKAQ_18]MCP3777140.1 GNAT family N-acetyltransferase [Paenibacillus sp. MZ03-122A]